jgi:DNA-binding NtrC family response regulator
LATVLVVDDEKNILLSLQQALSLAGYGVELASSAQGAFEALSKKPVDAILMDVQMPDMDGISALEKLAGERPSLPIIMMSGHGTIDMAVKATQRGAADFLEKPIARERMLVALKNALSHRDALAELDELRSEAGKFEMVGNSPAIQRVYELIARAAPSEGRVLITGENGTGKELIARAIHQNSQRKSRSFIKLNCASVPHELIESELFGHERGAFTGAVSARRGKFELAHQGTLFLDEIGDMPSPMQVKLLRVLQESEFERVGGSETFRVDVRVIAATNRDLEKMISDGQFREDLYYRLNVVHIHSPPLRERAADIPLLASSLLAEACKKNGRREMVLSGGALAALGAYTFPGNVRELRNLAERMAILCEGPTLSAAEVEDLLPRRRLSPPPAAAPVALPPAGSSADAVPSAGVTFREQVEEAERQIILKALAQTRDNVTEAARLLDLERGHFYKKMKALGMRRGAPEGPK